MSFAVLSLVLSFAALPVHGRLLLNASNPNLSEHVANITEGVNASQTSNSSSGSELSGQTKSWDVTCYAKETIQLAQAGSLCTNVTFQPYQKDDEGGLRASMICRGPRPCAGVTVTGFGQDDLEDFEFRQKSMVVLVLLLLWVLGCCAGVQKLCRAGNLSEEETLVLSMSGMTRQVCPLTGVLLYWLVSHAMVPDSHARQEVDCKDHPETDLHFTVHYLATRLILATCLYLVLCAAITAWTVIDRIRAMPEGTCFLARQQLDDFIELLLSAEPCWVDRSVANSGSSEQKAYFRWRNLEDGIALQELKDACKGRTHVVLNLQVAIELEGDWTRETMSSSEGIFDLELNGQTLTRNGPELSLVIYIRSGFCCGRDIFWSMFLPCWLSNTFFLGMSHVIDEFTCFGEHSLRVTKFLNFLPHEELRSKIAAASAQGVGSGQSLLQSRAVDRIMEWRQRALLSAHRARSSSPQTAPRRDAMRAALEGRLGDLRIPGAMVEDNNEDSGSDQWLTKPLFAKSRQVLLDEDEPAAFRTKSDPRARACGSNDNPRALREKKQRGQQEFDRSLEEDDEDEEEDAKDDREEVDEDEVERTEEDAEVSAMEQHYSRGPSTREDWYKLISEAERWLADTCLELARKESCFGGYLEKACEVVSAGLLSGRLSSQDPQCGSLLTRLQKAFDRDLKQALASMNRHQIDRLCAACDPLIPVTSESMPKASSDVPSIIPMASAKMIMSNLTYILHVATRTQDRDALSLALLEAFRLCGDMCRQRSRICLGGELFNVRQQVEFAMLQYRSALLGDVQRSTGLSCSVFGHGASDTFSPPWCQKQLSGPLVQPPGTLDARWRLKIESKIFVDEMQALFDMTGNRIDFPFEKNRSPERTCELRVLGICRAVDPFWVQSYLACREDIKVGTHPKNHGAIGDVLTETTTGAWTQEVARNAQGVWEHDETHEIYVVQGNQVFVGAVLLAETLNSQCSTRLRADYGWIYIRDIYRHDMQSNLHSLLGGPDQLELHCVLVPGCRHSGPQRQMHGHLMPDFSGIRWNSGPKTDEACHWQRNSRLLGTWLIGGAEAIILPNVCFAQAGLMLDQVAAQTTPHNPKDPHGVAWVEARNAALMADAHRETTAWQYLLYFHDQLFPIWDDPISSVRSRRIAFRSLQFTGFADVTGRVIHFQEKTGVPRSLLEHSRLRSWNLVGRRTVLVIELAPRPLQMGANEVWLFQGTREGILDMENPTELQRRLSGAHHGAFWGPGIYLTDSVARADECTEPGANGICAIILCRAVLGKLIHQQKGNKIFSGNVMNRNYHSVKASGKYNDFMCCELGQVLPEFIVYYRRDYSLYHSKLRL
eukprot:TRINITY_DN8392_c0_g2_i1.p1 TRINITY_DN8392_c0_g2~~TRINITY_DN8392_c0_g2_i1.p1  ORF type:complete len:1366 (+),score=228.47 TRINITY_DN8392_c0_g2_i1:80-4099(+)